MSFKLLKSSTRGAYNRFSGLPYPTISIVKKYIFFNKMAIDSFGLEDPDNDGAVLVFLDEQESKLGFRPAKKKTLYSYAITVDQSSRYRMTMNKELVAFCEDKIGKVFRLTKEIVEPVQAIGELFMADLKSPEEG